MAFGMACPHAEAAMQFLHTIGLNVQVESGVGGFIDHVLISEGGLRVDPRAPASGLLHEAGHLAIMPAQFRHYLNGNLYQGFKRMLDDVAAMDLEPDEPLWRAVNQVSDQEATAWAWAAGKAIGIPDQLIIQDDEYSGEGAPLRLSLGVNAYAGINGMSCAGFCVPRHNPYKALPVYPTLAFWLQQ